MPHPKRSDFLMKRLFSILLVLLSLHGSWFVASAQAQAISNEERFAQAHNDMARIADVGELVRLATRHHDEGDWVRAAVAWERASSLRPFNANFLYELAANSAQYGNLPRAFEALLVLQTRGHGFDLEADRRLVNLHGTPLWQHLVELNKTALESAFGEGERVHELPPADLLLESIAWDTRSKKLLLGSARDGTIYRLDKDGTLEPWSQPQGEQWWSIFDVKVDAPRNLVWATTSAVPHFKGFKDRKTSCRERVSDPV